VPINDIAGNFFSKTNEFTSIVYYTIIIYKYIWKENARDNNIAPDYYTYIFKYGYMRVHDIICCQRV
jgi:hypothetical protein